VDHITLGLGKVWLGGAMPYSWKDKRYPAFVTSVASAEVCA